MGSGGRSRGKGGALGAEGPSLQIIEIGNIKVFTSFCLCLCVCVHFKQEYYFYFIYGGKPARTITIITQLDTT